ncbi:hypothetical protein PanWU01x14_036290 [Parasponia andersonii]|uniref:Uncharacterized protein n=1 Tax=Parasponia andersonii TaxID=3476 RepID=A0A2P5DSF4_PARAD|nr:hypothetical protein PanWU01x14_036290 [Parasponia andersonii]
MYTVRCQASYQYSNCKLKTKYPTTKYSFTISITRDPTPQIKCNNFVFETDLHRRKITGYDIDQVTSVASKECYKCSRFKQADFVMLAN